MLKIAHLYPDLMNLYGDQGNLTVLQRRAAWYGEKLEIVEVGIGASIPWKEIDMLFMGGGSDREQGLVTKDFTRHAAQMLAAIEQGMPGLFICGAYQLLGKEYMTMDGKAYPGLNLFPFLTGGSPQRLTGDIALECEIEGKKETVVGFENHSGRTWLEGAELQPWGKVLKGYGNNGEDGQEGFQFLHLIATYLHGPLLPKNPAVADFFLRKMFERKGLEMKAVLDDSLEKIAHQQILQRMLSSRKSS